MMNTPPILIGLLGVGLFVAVPGVSADEPKPIALKADDAKSLRVHLGKPVEISGKIERVHHWDGGAEFLNFKGSTVSIVCFKRNYPAFGDKLPTQRYKGKLLAVSGILREYKGKLQVELTSPDQVTIKTESKVDSTKESSDSKEPEAPFGKPPKKGPKKMPKKVDPADYFC